MTPEFKQNNFDLLRILAALQVLLLHSIKHLELNAPHWMAVFSYFPGVTMFFVMSGFLISASYERNSDLRNYFRNRALRIYPALWVCIVISVIVISAITGISVLNRQALPWFISQLAGIIYTPGFLSNYGFGSYNGSLWTIPIELQFYCILPIVYWMVISFTEKESIKNSLIFAVFCISLIMGYEILVNFSKSDIRLETKVDKLLRYTFLPHIYMFFWGVLLQRIKVYRWKFINGKGLILVVAYIVFRYFVPDTPVFSIAGKLFLGVVVISLAYTLPTLSHKLLRGNDISYGVYIYHCLILGVFVQLKFIHSFYYLLLIFAGACTLGFLSWIFIEKPMLHRKNKSIKPVDDFDLVPVNINYQADNLIPKAQRIRNS